MAEVNVGESLAITAPVPYPFGSPITPGVPFKVDVSASTPGGAPISAAPLTAQLIYEGRVVADVPLSPLGAGSYGGSTTLAPSSPQGSYELVVRGPSMGSAFSYLYVGEAVTGVMLTPNDDAITSVAPGEQVTLLAQTRTAAGEGIFTSNVTAKVFSLSGAQMASVRLTPAPNTVQFGVFDFFRYQQANYTVPKNLTQGFYKLEFLSSYRANSTAPTVLGNFTTGFYVSGGRLSYAISTPATAYEGQYVEVAARITDQTGAPVTSGVFLATFIPSGYVYEAYLTDFYGYTSVPMVYNTALGAWEAEYQIPSVLSSPSPFVGNLLSLSSGPWTVYVSGESAAASNVVPSSSYVDVLPYTYYLNGTLSASNIGSAPLVAVNGTGYLLSNIGADHLTISGISITLADSSIGNLTVDNATVRLVASQVGSVSATGSSLFLLHGTDVGALSLKSTTLTVSGSFYGQPSGASQQPLEYLAYGSAVVAVLAIAIAVVAYLKKGPRAEAASPRPPQV